MPSVNLLVMEVELAIHDRDNRMKKGGVRNFDVCTNDDIPKSGVRLYLPKDDLKAGVSTMQQRRNPISISHTSQLYTVEVEKARVTYHVSLEGSTLFSTWLCESQNMEKLQKCLRHGTVLIKITPDMTPMECFATGRCTA